MQNRPDNKSADNNKKSRRIDSLDLADRKEQKSADQTSRRIAGLDLAVGFSTLDIEKALMRFSPNKVPDQIPNSNKDFGRMTGIESISTPVVKAPISSSNLNDTMVKIEQALNTLQNSKAGLDTYKLNFKDEFGPAQGKVQKLIADHQRVEIDIEKFSTYKNQTFEQVINNNVQNKTDNKEELLKVESQAISLKKQKERLSNDVMTTQRALNELLFEVQFAQKKVEMGLPYVPARGLTRK